MSRQSSNRKLLIADDHPLTLLGLRQFLEPEGFEIFEAPDARTAQEIFNANPIDVAVLDISMPSKRGERNEGTNEGLRLAECFKQKHPETGIVLLSSHPDRGQYFYNLVIQGYRGLAYILKNGNPNDVLNAINLTQEGGVYCDKLVTTTNDFAREIIKRLSQEECEWVLYAVKELPNLTKREQEVVSALLDSYDIGGIAIRMAITDNAVSNHIRNIYEKLGLNQIQDNLSARTLLIKARLIFDLQQG